MGRIKELSRKPARTRKRNPVVYLICEGSETEIRYFKRFRSRGCNIDIIPISSQYKSADRLVQKAKATMGNNPYYPDEGDSIWCVFDRDDNSNEVLLRAKQSAQKEGYHLAYSNPSFELWFLLHFVNQQTDVLKAGEIQLSLWWYSGNCLGKYVQNLYPDSTFTFEITRLPVPA